MPSRWKGQQKRWGKEIAEDERSHSEPLDSLPLPRTLYLGMDGTGIPLRAEELVGRTGKQPDGSAKTGECKALHYLERGIAR